MAETAELVARCPALHSEYCRGVCQGHGGYRSLATILLSEVFQAIGRKAKVPVSALYKPEVTLRVYSQRPILVGALVDFEVEFNGKSVVVPIYLRAARHAGSEPCLLGTNIVGPLGLMCPAAGAEPNGGDGSRIPLRLFSWWWYASPTHSLTHSLTNPHTHSPTHSHTHSLTHPPTHSPTQPTHSPPTHSPTHQPTHSLTPHPLTNPHTHSPTHTHSLTHSLTYPPTHTSTHPLNPLTHPPPTHLPTHSPTHTPTLPLTHPQQYLTKDTA